jgi:hypothetical protein
VRSDTDEKLDAATLTANEDSVTPMVLFGVWRGFETAGKEVDIVLTTNKCLNEAVEMGK